MANILIFNVIVIIILLWYTRRAILTRWRLSAARRMMAAAQVDIKMLKEYFTNYHRFQFVVSLPSTWSGLLLFNQLAADGSGAVERKLVIKFALNWQLDPIVANELNYLRALRGSEHVVQIVSLRGVPGGGASAGTIGRSRSSNIINNFLNMFFQRVRRRRPRSRASGAGSGSGGSDPRSSTLDFSIFSSGLGSINDESTGLGLGGSSDSGGSGGSDDSNGSDGGVGGGGIGGIMARRGPLLDRAYFILEYELGGALKDWVGRGLGEDELWCIFLCRECIPY